MKERGNYEWFIRFTAYCPDLSGVKVGDEATLKLIGDNDYECVLNGQEVEIHTYPVAPAVCNILYNLRKYEDCEDFKEPQTRLTVTQCGLVLKRHGQENPAYDNIELEFAVDLDTLEEDPYLYVDDSTTAVHLCGHSDEMELHYGNDARVNEIEFVEDGHNIQYLFDTGNKVLMWEYSLVWGCDDSQIPEWACEIGAEAFSYCKKMSSVVIPKDVLYIGSMAFYNCRGLETVVIGEGTQLIDRYAFEGCESLKHIVFPESLQGVAKNAFKGCKNLESVEFKRDVVVVIDDAFEDCPKLKPENIKGNIKWHDPFVYDDDENDVMAKYTNYWF